ncbi:MAG TPA: ferredoxin--NADP reductase, partial [Deltaproteobacteria bacterium]|nr:ferredoxin--NADP reductase [Deltaproteobacteria bacterium]
MAGDELNAILAERIDYGPSLAVLRIIPNGWEVPNFKPGQYTTLGVLGSTPRCSGSDPDKTPIADPTKLLKRAYSIASAPHEKNYVEFNIALVKGGLFTPRLWNLKVGDPLFLGPKITGTFTMDPVPKDKNIVFIGTGTGLGPFMSMIYGNIETLGSRKFAVLHGVRTSQELCYRGELAALARMSSNFAYLPIISR